MTQVSKSSGYAPKKSEKQEKIKLLSKQMLPATQERLFNSLIQTMDRYNIGPRTSTLVLDILSLEIKEQIKSREAQNLEVE